MVLEQEELTGAIIAAAIEVHKQLGPGFIESIYENALVIELRKRGMKVEQQVDVRVLYDDKEVGKHRLDLLVEDEIVIELKAIKNIDDVHYAIARSYLRATGKQHGLILNFSKTTLEIKRVINRDVPGFND
jgi:GxxExxY protein